MRTEGREGEDEFVAANEKTSREEADRQSIDVEEDVSRKRRNGSTSSVEATFSIA